MSLYRLWRWSPEWQNPKIGPASGQADRRRLAGAGADKRMGGWTGGWVVGRTAALADSTDIQTDGWTYRQHRWPRWGGHTDGWVDGPADVAVAVNFASPSWRDLVPHNISTLISIYLLKEFVKTSQHPDLRCACKGAPEQ